MCIYHINNFYNVLYCRQDLDEVNFIIRSPLERAWGSFRHGSSGKGTTWKKLKGKAKSCSIERHISDFCQGLLIQVSWKNWLKIVLLALAQFCNHTHFEAKQSLEMLESIIRGNPTSLVLRGESHPWQWPTAECWRISSALCGRHLS